MKKKTALIMIALALVITFLIYACDFRLKTVNYSVKSGKATQPFRIAFISDLHCCKYGENQSELIEAVRAQKPDFVFFGGDIFDDNLPWQNSLTLLETLGSEFDCYFITGNHEARTGKADEIKEKVENCGITVLDAQRGSFVSIGGINIFGTEGVDYGEKTTVFFADLESAKSAAPKGYNILLAHFPEDIEHYAEMGFDLVLSGHAHGGQFRIPYLLNGLYAPGQGFFPKYAGGYYRVQSTDFIVSRGLARESTPLPRIFNRPELVIVDVE